MLSESYHENLDQNKFVLLILEVKIWIPFFWIVYRIEENYEQDFIQMYI